MGRNIEIDARRGGGAAHEILFGDVTIQATALHQDGTKTVFPDDTTIGISNGLAVLENVDVSPAGPEPAWAYKMTFRNHQTGRGWTEMVGVPAGSGPVKYPALTRFTTTLPPETTKAELQSWVATTEAAKNTAVQAAATATAPTDATMADKIGTKGTLTETALSAAIGDSTAPLVDGASGRLVSTLRRGSSDAVLTVLGDSTGNETVEWVYRLSVWLGQNFPAYTVIYRLWNDATQAYGSPETIQTGTGPRAFSIYNGSHPGASYDYAANSTRFPKLIPVEPTTVAVSFGYNSTGTTYKVQQLKVADFVLSKFPGIEYVLTAQPPKRKANFDAADHLKRQEDTRTLASQERWGLIDATQPFIDYGNYDDLISTDEIHPNAPGRDLWFAEVQKYFGTLTQSQTPSVAAAVTNRIFVPASNFVKYFGDPTLDFQSGIIMPKWNFDSLTDEMMCCMVDIPPSWKTVDVDLLWGSPVGAAGAVAWKLDWYSATPEMNISSGKPFSGSENGVAIPVNVSANVIRVTPMLIAQRFGPGRPVAFRITRLGTHAEDTCTPDAWLFGLVIRRAE